MALAQLKSSVSGSASPRKQAVHAVSRQTSKGAAWKLNQSWTKGNPAQFPRNPAEGDRGHAKLCGFCGNKAHGRRDTCPAKGKQCKICNKWNHFTKVPKPAKYTQ